MTNEGLVARGLRKRYGTDIALAGVDLAIDKGEVVAIVGPSGSGKSTLLYCLSGIVTPDEGSVRFADTDLATLPDAARTKLRRTAFGFVLQFGQLVPELSLIENVALPLLLGGESMQDAAPKAMELFELVEIGALAKRRPGEVSGGEAQRAAVCRALVTNPAIVFADEPTGALDSRTGRTVLALLLQAAAARNAAVVLVTHERFVARRAHRTVSLRDGAIVSPGE